MSEQTPQSTTLPVKKHRSNTTALFMAIGISLGGLGVIVGLGVFFVNLITARMNDLNKKVYHSEPKTNLSAIYAAEKAMFAEWDQYTTDLTHIGFKPEGKLRYKIGFVQANEPTGPLAEVATDLELDPKRSNTDFLFAHYSDRAPASSFQELAAKYCPDCIVGDKTFKVVAIGNLDDDETLDVWTIDQDKNLVNILDDTKD